jgi:hypothetical protein
MFTVHFTGNDVVISQKDIVCMWQHVPGARSIKYKFLRNLEVHKKIKQESPLLGGVEP